MKFGRHLQENIEPEWAEYYVPYRKLKKMIKALVARNVGIQPTTFKEVSLSTPPPTNQAAQFDEDLEGIVTQEMFFEEISRQLERMEQFTDAMVKKLKQELIAIDTKLGNRLLPNKVSDAMIENQVDKIAKQFLKLEKYVNLNITAFSKILKKHDKRLPNAAKSFYMDRIHQQAWVRGDYSDVMMHIGSIYQKLRGDTGPDNLPTEQDVRKSRAVYWIRNEDISKVKYILLQNLPVLHSGSHRSDSRLMSSVYLDNAPLEFYHNLVTEANQQGAGMSLRIRWHGAGDVRELSVERSVQRPMTTSDPNEMKMCISEDRFYTSEMGIQKLLDGTFDVDAEAAKMRQKGASNAEMEEFKSLAQNISQVVVSKQLHPTIRTQFMRTNFQGGSTSSSEGTVVQIAFDSNICMVNERAKTEYKSHAPTPREFFQPWGTPGEVLQYTGSYSQNLNFQEEAITRLPFATLEVQLQQVDDVGAVPVWLTQLVTSGMLTQVDGFSKYLHAAGILFADEVQQRPSWFKHPLFQQLTPVTMVSDVSMKKNTILSHLMTERRKLTNQYHSGKINLPPMRPIYDEEEDNSCCMWCHAYADFFSAPVSGDVKPMVKPKIYMANERTFIKWIHIAVYLAALGLALISFETSTDGTAMTLAFSVLIISFVFILYGTLSHNARVKKIKRGLSFRWDDPFGPTLMAITFSAVLLYNFLDRLYVILADEL